VGGSPDFRHLAFVQTLPEGIREVTLVKLQPLLLLVARQALASSDSEARIPMPSGMGSVNLQLTHAIYYWMEVEGKAQHCISS
jgi:hypothetical protein